MAEERQPWDREPAEPAEAYARFLLYRNLGPMRSIDKAYALVASTDPSRAQRARAKGGKKRRARATPQKRAPGQWWEDSAKYHWPERAQAWDIAVLTEAGQAVVVKFVATLNAVFERILVTLENPRAKPGARTWESIIESLTIVGAFVPQETIPRSRAHPAPNGPRVGDAGVG